MAQKGFASGIEGLRSLIGDVPSKVSIVQKNEYFWYFQIDGCDARFRLKDQIWCARGMSMKISGSMNIKGKIENNSFGKRHLISTDAKYKEGLPEGIAEQMIKAVKISRKRTAHMQVPRNSDDARLAFIGLSVTKFIDV